MLLTNQGCDEEKKLPIMSSRLDAMKTDLMHTHKQHNIKINKSQTYNITWPTQHLQSPKSDSDNNHNIHHIYIYQTLHLKLTLQD